jgi:hypothetical protein
MDVHPSTHTAGSYRVENSPENIQVTAVQESWSVPHFCLLL